MKAIDLRTKSIKETISTSPGLYKWYMSKELALTLNVPLDNCLHDTILGYFVYVGIAKNIQQRLDWHVNQKHTQSTVKSGFLSTLRQTLSALAQVPMDDESTVNDIIDQMSVEFEICESKEKAESIEKETMKNYSLPLNIMHNKHPFVKELKRLRSISKKKATSKY